MVPCKLWALVIWVLFSVQNASSCEDACWETCFQTIGTENERFRVLYDEILEAALEIKYLKNVYNAQNIAFLIDSAMSSHYTRADDILKERFTNASNIFKFEVMLGFILETVIQNTNTFLVQYDEQFAWTCDEFSCVTPSCNTLDPFRKQINIETGPTSHCPGNIEAACGLAYKQMTELSCAAPSNQTNMIVAITNGKFHLNDESSSSESDEDNHKCPPRNALFGSSSSSEEEFSPCKQYFATRYVIGTHRGSRESLERLHSFHGDFKFINAETFSLDGLQQLNTCLQLSCRTPAPIVAVTCKKTQDSLGRIVGNLTFHPGSSPTYALF